MSASAGVYALERAASSRVLSRGRTSPTSPRQRSCRRGRVGGASHRLVAGGRAGRRTPPLSIRALFSVNDGTVAIDMTSPRDVSRYGWRFHGGIPDSRHADLRTRKSGLPVVTSRSIHHHAEDLPPTALNVRYPARPARTKTSRRPLVSPETTPAASVANVATLPSRLMVGGNVTSESDPDPPHSRRQVGRRRPGSARRWS
jgi:hypothetical protein